METLMNQWLVLIEAKPTLKLALRTEINIALDRALTTDELKNLDLILKYCVRVCEPAAEGVTCLNRVYGLDMERRASYAVGASPLVDLLAHGISASFINRNLVNRVSSERVNCLLTAVRPILESASDCDLLHQRTLYYLQRKIYNTPEYRDKLAQMFAQLKQEFTQGQSESPNPTQ